MIHNRIHDNALVVKEMLENHYRSESSLGIIIASYKVNEKGDRIFPL